MQDLALTDLLLPHLALLARQQRDHAPALTAWRRCWVFGPPLSGPAFSGDPSPTRHMVLRWPMHTWLPFRATLRSVRYWHHSVGPVWLQRHCLFVHGPVTAAGCYTVPISRVESDKLHPSWTFIYHHITVCSFPWRRRLTSGQVTSCALGESATSERRNDESPMNEIKMWDYLISN